MRPRVPAAALAACLLLLTVWWAAPVASQQQGDVAPVPGGVQPTPFDTEHATADPQVSAAGDGDGLTPTGVGTGAFAQFRVYATQYLPNTPGSVEVAVPDKCVKFAALGWTGPLADQCPSGYPLNLNYRVVVTRDSGQSATFPVKEVGPWNTDDNYWAGPGSPRPRRLFGDLPRGVPEAQAARAGYNTKPCLNLDRTPSGRSAGADQFDRCVLNPAGIDLSVEAAKQLGLANLQNENVTVTFLWEPLATTVRSVHSGKALDVVGVSTQDGAGIQQWAAYGSPNQLWKFVATGTAHVYTVLSVHSGKALDVRGVSTADGARIQQWTSYGSANQQWRVVPTGTAGVFALVAVHSGKALDVEGVSSSDGAPIQQWAPHGGANQLWRLSLGG